MVSEDIFVQNLKCGGCAHTLSQGLLKIEGVQKVDVDVENGMVRIERKEDISKQLVLDTLLKMGYPAQDQANGLFTQAKSYVSCMIGKVGATQVNNE